MRDRQEDRRRAILKHELKKIYKSCFDSQNHAAEVLFYMLDDVCADNEDVRKKFGETFRKQIGKKSKTAPEKLEYYIGLLLSDERCKNYKLAKETIENLPQVKELTNQLECYKYSERHWKNLAFRAVAKKSRFRLRD